MSKPVTSTTSRSGLIDNIADSTGYSRRMVAETVQAMIDQIRVDLEDRRRVVIHGLGAFEVYRAKGRNRNNPNTGQPVYIEPHLKVRFTVAPTIRQMFRKADR